MNINTSRFNIASEKCMEKKGTATKFPTKTNIKKNMIHVYCVRTMWWLYFIHCASRFVLVYFFRLFVRFDSMWCWMCIFCGVLFLCVCALRCCVWMSRSQLFNWNRFVYGKKSNVSQIFAALCCLRCFFFYIIPPSESETKTFISMNNTHTHTHTKPNPYIHTSRAFAIHHIQWIRSKIDFVVLNFNWDMVQWNGDDNMNKLPLKFHTKPIEQRYFCVWAYYMNSECVFFLSQKF